MPILMADVVQLVKNEQVYVCEARAGFRVACLVLNRTGIDKSELARVADALETLEKVITAMEMGLIGSVAEHSLQFWDHCCTLSGSPSLGWMEAHEAWLGGAYREAFLKLLEERITARIKALRPGEHPSYVHNVDDVNAALAAGHTSGLQGTVMMALLSPLLAVMEIASDLTRFQSDVWQRRMSEHDAQYSSNLVGPELKVTSKVALEDLQQVGAAESNTETPSAPRSPVNVDAPGANATPPATVEGAVAAAPEAASTVAPEPPAAAPGAHAADPPATHETTAAAAPSAA